MLPPPYIIDPGGQLYIRRQHLGHMYLCDVAESSFNL